MRPRFALLLTSGALTAMMACAPADAPPTREAAATPPPGPCAGLNTLTDAEKAEGWELLFDGESLAGWHGYNGRPLDSWSVEDCTIMAAGTESNRGGDRRGDLTTDREFTNFELALEWKASEGGNSGLIYAIVEDPAYEAPWMTGPEYQLMDDATREPKDITSTASDYDMLAPSTEKELKPAGEWNTSRIVVNGPHVEHWLNGKKVLEFERWSDEWKERVAAGKWARYEDYGLAETGRIAIQDHGSRFWFRNVKIREIGEDAAGDEGMDDESE